MERPLRFLCRAAIFGSSVAVLLADARLVPADEPAPQAPAPRLVRVRVIGLFAPARVDALREAAWSVEEAALQEVDYEAAHATFAIHPERGWKDVPEEKLAERIDQALRRATRSTIAAAPASQTPADRLIEARFAAYGCACQGCELAAYEAVARIDGVERATANFRDSEIVVRFDREKTSRDALAEALKRRGVSLEPPPEE